MTLICLSFPGSWKPRGPLSRGVTLGMSFCCCLTGCSVLLNARSSFRVASDFQEFLQRFDEVLVQSSKLGQMLWLRAFWSSPSFKEARDFQVEQRERERERLGVSFRLEISAPPTRCSSNEIGLEGRRSAYTRLLPVHPLSAYLHCHMKKISFNTF